MIENTKQLRTYSVMLWSSLVGLIVFTVLTVLAILNIFPGPQILYVVIFAVLTFVFTAGFTLSLKAHHDQKQFVQQLRVENSYTLGMDATFYNLDAFKNRVNRLYRKRSNRDKLQYVIAFTPTAADISSSANRNKILTDLNQRLAKFLSNLFSRENKNGFLERNNIYAFNRGTFLIYCFTEDEKYPNKLVATISNECFRLVNEEKIKIWVQPFFGIKAIKGNESVTSAVEDAMLARNQSEKNYESFTYFRESFLNRDYTGGEEITRALENNEFIPYYQLKYNIKEKRFVSAEVLARWKTPDGVKGPGKFIEMAERSGLLNAIDLAIFEKAIKDTSDSLKRGRRTLPVSVNFSLYEFFSRRFIETIVGTLKKYQVPPTYLEIEITETTSQVNKFLSISVIKKLKELGIRVLMDDFGMGYSQIESLRQIPFDAIKIDKSFSDKILTDEKTKTIVKYLVELAHTNGMEAIVEGVETKEQVEVLRKLKIDTIQGFYYSRPLPFDEYNLMIKSNTFEKEGNK